MEEGQTPDRVERDQHLNQELFMFCLQRQSEAIDYTGDGGHITREKAALINHEDMKASH